MTNCKNTKSHAKKSSSQDSLLAKTQMAWIAHLTENFIQE